MYRDLPEELTLHAGQVCRFSGYPCNKYIEVSDTNVDDISPLLEFLNSDSVADAPIVTPNDVPKTDRSAFNRKIQASSPVYTLPSEREKLTIKKPGTEKMSQKYFK